MQSCRLVCPAASRTGQNQNDNFATENPMPVRNFVKISQNLTRQKNNLTRLPTKNSEILFKIHMASPKMVFGCSESVSLPCCVVLKCFRTGWKTVQGTYPTELTYPTMDKYTLRHNYGTLSTVGYVSSVGYVPCMIFHPVRKVSLVTPLGRLKLW